MREKVKYSVLVLARDRVRYTWGKIMVRDEGIVVHRYGHGQ